jgi:hypothetical protein
MLIMGIKYSIVKLQELWCLRDKNRPLRFPAINFHPQPDIFYRPIVGIVFQ